MYQILSLKEGKEYNLFSDEYFDYSVNEIKSYDDYGKPIFSTLLEFLNCDFLKMARDKFIDIVSFCSTNYLMKDVPDIIKINGHGYGGYKNRNQERRDELFFDYLYTLFPGEKRRKSASQLKTKRKKSLSGKQIQEKAIDCIFNDFKSDWNESHYTVISELRRYIDAMKSNDALRNPAIFYSFVDTAIKTNLLHLTSDTGIFTAIPFLGKDVEEYHKIEEFIKAVQKNYSESGYENYIINTRSDWHEWDAMNIILSDIYFILQQGWSIKKCENCGKYFIAYTRSDIIYCQDISPQDPNKTCKEYAATRGYYLSKKNDDFEYLRNKVRDRLSKRAQRDAFNQENYNKFREYDKLWKKALKNNAEQKQPYFEWLQSVDSITAVNTGNIDTAEPKPPIETEG